VHEYTGSYLHAYSIQVLFIYLLVLLSILDLILLNADTYYGINTWVEKKPKILFAQKNRFAHSNNYHPRFHLILVRNIDCI
jgi:hypothetical protein